MTLPATIAGDWYPGAIPANVEVEEGAYLETSYSFDRFRSTQPKAVRIGRGASVYLGAMFDLGPRARVQIGRFSLVNGAWIICDAEVSVGDACLISWNVVLMDTFRLPWDIAARRRELERIPHRRPRRAHGTEPGNPIRIGHNVWIGFDVCVLPGVTIGEGSVVGARSVVIDDVPAFTVVAGNPARRLRRLDPDELADPELRNIVEGR